MFFSQFECLTVHTDIAALCSSWLMTDYTRTVD